MAKKTIKQFCVEGSGPFPVDMLRYDRCYPIGQDDASLITQRRGGRRYIWLETYNMGAPTVGRWQSFMWRVTDVKSM